MKTLCKNKTPEERLKAIKTVKILLLIAILSFVVVMIFDLVQGLPIESSRTSILCADVCILCACIKQQRDLQKEMEDKNK